MAPAEILAAWNEADRLFEAAAEGSDERAEMRVAKDRLTEMYADAIRPPTAKPTKKKHKPRLGFGDFEKMVARMGERYRLIGED